MNAPKILRRRFPALLLLIVYTQYIQFSHSFSLTHRPLSTFSHSTAKIRPQCDQPLVSLYLSGGEEMEIDIPSDIDWKEVEKSVFEGEDKRPVILFDGVCNLCNGAVNFALDYDEVGYFRFASLQSTIGRALLIRENKDPSDLSSIVLVDQDKAYFKSEAVVRIAEKLDYPLPIFAFGGKLMPNFLRNKIYEYVSKNRYRFGVLEDSCRLWDDNFDKRFISDPEKGN